MNKKFINIDQIFFIIISLFFWIYLLGTDYIDPSNIEWLFLGDLPQAQLGWEFFRDDYWRFPFGSNPNYGIYFGGSIVFSDSIPIFAILFKLINFLLPENFQYFSIWILLCIYLQQFFSFKILYNLTNNKIYSFVGSLFFIFSTVLIQRSGIHLSLMGQWIILWYIYVETIDKKNKFFLTLFTFLFSVLIHFYFTIILFILFLSQNLFDLINRKIDIKTQILKTFTIIFFVIFLMYIIGYFTINFDDGLGWGYGYYNFNLNSFFNPKGYNYVSNFNWSYFLPTLDLQNQEKEGFSYLGISGIIFLFFFIINFFKSKYEIIYSPYKLLFIFIIFLSLATSNNINFGDLNLINISLNKYIYASLSSIRASGRLIWLVYYFILIFGIIYIYKTYKKKHSIFILSLLLIIQIIDLSPGLMKYKTGSQYIQKNQISKININYWNKLLINSKQLRMTEPENNSYIYNILKEYILRQNFKKTDIAYLARVNREALVSERYKLIKVFNQKEKKIFEENIFVSDNVNFVRNLNYLYKKELNFYFKNGIWLISDTVLNSDHKKNEHYNQLDIYEIDLNESNLINFYEEKNSPVGMGWIVDKKNNHLILDGVLGSILFKVKKEKCKNNLNLRFKIDKFYPEISKPMNLKISVNQNYKKLDLSKINLNKEILMKFDCQNENINEINFDIENAFSLHDLKKGLNREKRSVILNSISIYE